MMRAFEIVALGVFIYYGVPWLICQCMILALRKRTQAQRAVCLTLDDGPGGTLTGEILDILHAYQVKVSFFVIGSRALLYPQMVRRIISEGHQICSHGYEHINHWHVAPWRAIRDMRSGWLALDEIAGRTIKCPFRPAYGRLTIVTLVYLWLKGVPIVFWTFDTGDTWQDLIPITERLAVFERNANGVVLLHDFDRKVLSRQQYVKNLIHGFLDIAAKKNLRLLTVSEFLLAKDVS